MGILLKESINKAMLTLAEDPKRVFIGYNLSHGSQCYGTLAQVAPTQILEMPVAEYLYTGMGLGMALAGLKPVIIFERQDFLWTAMDMIINHIEKIAIMSRGQFQAPLIIRVITGTKTPLYPGPQHCQDYTRALTSLLSIPVVAVESEIDVHDYLEPWSGPVMFIEYRELYEKTSESSTQPGAAEVARPVQEHQR